MSGYIEQYALRLSELENVEYHSLAQAPWRGYLFSIKADTCPDLDGECICWISDPDLDFIDYLNEGREADREIFEPTYELAEPIFPWQGAKCTVS